MSRVEPETSDCYLQLLDLLAKWRAERLDGSITVHLKRGEPYKVNESSWTPLKTAESK